MQYCIRHPYWFQYFAAFNQYTKDQSKAVHFETIDDAKAFAAAKNKPFTLDICVVEDNR